MNTNILDYFIQRQRFMNANNIQFSYFAIEDFWGLKSKVIKPINYVNCAPPGFRKFTGAPLNMDLVKSDLNNFATPYTPGSLSPINRIQMEVYSSPIEITNFINNFNASVSPVSPNSSVSLNSSNSPNSPNSSNSSVSPVSEEFLSPYLKEESFFDLESGIQEEIEKVEEIEKIEKVKKVKKKKLKIYFKK